MHRSRGFTMIELLVTFALAAILTTLAVPGFRLWIANSAVRSTADALQNGLRTASAEAVRRSSQVIFVVSAASQKYGATPATSGNYWYIQAVPTLTSQTVDSSYYILGSPQSFASNGVNITTTASVVCFNSIGRQVTNTGTGGTWPGLPAACTAGDTTYNITGRAGTRPLNVIASLGGKIRMCDPSRTFSTTNPDGC